VYVTRSIAPFPSSTSLLQLSHTRTVLRAMDLKLAEIQESQEGTLFRLQTRLAGAHEP
jgi:hypothetical protein